MVHEQCTRFAFFIFWPSRGRHGQTGGNRENVNDESCSTRRALLAYQLSFKTVENPRSSMPNLLIFLTFSKFVTLWPWPWDENEKSSSVGLCRCHWANQIPKPLPDSTNPLGEDVNWNRLPPKNTCFLGVAPPTMGVARPHPGKHN